MALHASQGFALSLGLNGVGAWTKREHVRPCRSRNLVQQYELKDQLICKCRRGCPAVGLYGSSVGSSRARHGQDVDMMVRWCAREPGSLPRAASAGQSGAAVLNCGAIHASASVAEPSTEAAGKLLAKRIAVIGSGVSGLAAAKAFLQEGLFQVKIYEQQKELGGLWVRTYSSARIQNGKAMYEFSDWPMPASFPQLPSKEQVKHYLSDYAHHFKVTDKIEFGTRVARMHRSSSPGGASSWADCKWTLDLEKEGSDGVWHSHSSEEFDLVVVCLGNYSGKPKLPLFPVGKGPEVFQGKSTHSASFQDAHSLQGKRVAVVGFGKTALDLAVAVAAVQEDPTLPVTLVYRKAKWIIPRTAVEKQSNNPRPYMRFSELWVPKPDRHWGEHLLHTLGLPLVWLYWAIQERLLRGLLAGLVQKGYAPKASLRTDLSCQLALEPEGLQEMVMADRIVLKEVTDWHYSEHGLLLDGREHLSVDHVVLCTGYDGAGKVAALLPPQDRTQLTEHTDGLHLYRGIIHPLIPAMAFLGYNQTFSVVHSSELGALWVAKLASGAFAMPDAAAMEIEREKWRIFRQKHWLPYSEKGQCFAPLNLTYYDMLRADMGWPRLVLNPNPVKNIVAKIGASNICQP